MGKSRILKSEINIMEVCGTHSEVISKYAIRQLYKDKVKFTSGPGCPVCVISPEDIDLIVEYARNDIIIATFGDLVRVSGTKSSLIMERTYGRTIKTVYSPLESLDIAKVNPTKQVVFIGIGFETTVPLVALTIMKAKEQGIKNFSVLSLHRTMPAILRTLLKSNVKIDGLLLPGHVCAITGSKPFNFGSDVYGISGVVSGFLPKDVMQSIDMIIRDIDRPSVDIQYKRVVTPSGNIVAQKVIKNVFEPCDISWRGFGIVPKSGLSIKKEWRFFDARNRWHIKIPFTHERKDSQGGCRCGDILQGLARSQDCSLFKAICSPDKPFGPCMVSSEGPCAIFYKYGGLK